MVRWNDRVDMASCFYDNSDLSHDPVSKSVEKQAVGNCMIFNTQRPSFPWVLDKSKNAYLSRNHIIPDEAAVKGPGPTQSVASWFLDPDSCLIGNHVISQWEWVLAIMPGCQLSNLETN